MQTVVCDHVAAGGLLSVYQTSHRALTLWLGYPWRMQSYSGRAGAKAQGTLSKCALHFVKHLDFFYLRLMSPPESESLRVATGT